MSERVWYDPAELFEYVRQRKFACLDKACPLEDRCPDRHEFSFPIDKNAWLVRDCPKVREASGRVPKP